MSKKNSVILTTVAIVVLVAIFTIFDLRISQALFNETSLFGKVFEVAGESPAFLIGAFCLGGLIVTRNKTSKAKSLAAIIGYGILLVLVSLMAVFAIFNYLDLDFTAVMILPVLAVAVLAWFLASRIPQEKSAEFRRAAAIGIITLLAEILLVNVIKVGWGRMRMRDMIDPITQFTPWFLPQFTVSGETFKSFPSGHTANAAMLLWLTLLPTFLPISKQTHKWILGLSAAWVVLVMISRIVVGAHFATDTLFGVLITTGLFYLVKKIVNKKKK